MDSGGRQVQVWCADVPAAIAPALAQSWRALLSTEEHRQLERFHFDALKRRYLLTRALVRTVLSGLAPVAPAAWVFTRNAWGRPEIAAGPPAAQELRFNLSHTESQVVLAVARGIEVGIDIEDLRRHAPLDVAQRFFSAAEAAALAAMPLAGQQVARFWDLWTLKESYIKARGMGLHLPLDGFSFGFEVDGPLSLRVEPGLDDGRRWHFRQYRLPDEHLLALCLQAVDEAVPECRFTRGLPLQQQQDFELPAHRSSSAPQPR